MGVRMKWHPLSAKRIRFVFGFFMLAAVLTPLLISNLYHASWGRFLTSLLFMLAFVALLSNMLKD